ncbi:hypothetical protein ACA910_016032 [Epithemia clementina (nom. ined.)]
MLTARLIAKRATASVARWNGSSLRSMSSVSVTAKTKVTDTEDEENAISPVAKKMREMSRSDPNLVFGPAGDGVPAPVLPEDPSELSYIDPADLYNVAARYKMDGTERTVVICQESKSARQAPFHDEYYWHIKFNYDGMTSEKWTNSLMGWMSSGDPYQSVHDLTFNNAAEAVYFAKKRGWKYVVEEPIMRTFGELEIQYQDNFLSQALAAQVKAEGVQCRHWERSKAGSSHYFRPLKYHGDGTVRQHGPNREVPVAKHVEAVYKRR